MGMFSPRDQRRAQLGLQNIPHYPRIHSETEIFDIALLLLISEYGM